VRSTPAGINCGLLCGSQTTTFPSGTVVTLTASAILTAQFEQWSDDCSGTSTTCVITMDGDKRVVGHFRLLGFGGPAEQGSSMLRVRSTLLVRGGQGEVSTNGSTTRVAEGEAHLVAAEQPGDNLVEAWLREAKGEGFWRFDVTGREPLQPGTLRVISGELVGVAAGSVVFRVSGRTGERVAFAWTAVQGEVATRP
jgi:hypothetical protein